MLDFVSVQWLLPSHSLMFPPSRQTRPEKGELKVITIRHHKIVLRGVAHIKLVFWIAFLWKLRNCVRIFLNGWNCFYLYSLFITWFAIVLIEMRDGCFVHVFERPEGLGGPVWGWVRPRPRLIIPRLTADTEARTHFAAKTRAETRGAPDGHGLSSLLLVMLDTCDVVMLCDVWEMWVCGPCQSQKRDCAHNAQDKVQTPLFNWY